MRFDEEFDLMIGIFEEEELQLIYDIYSGLLSQRGRLDPSIVALIERKYHSLRTHVDLLKSLEEQALKSGRSPDEFVRERRRIVDHHRSLSDYLLKEAL